MDAHTLDCLDFDRVREMLAECALTSLGRGLCAGVRPVPRPDLIRRWMAQFTELDAFSREHGLPPLGGVSDVREAVRRSAPPLSLTPEEVSLIGLTLSATHAVTQYLAEAPPAAAELRHLAARIGDFRTIADRIQAVVDERGQVRDAASPKLARIRADIRAATQEIRDTVDRLLRNPDVRKILQFANYTLHNDRYVLPVRTEYRGRFQGIVHRSSDSGATVYVEPAAVVELNNQIVSLRLAEAEEINRLLWELVHEIHINQEAILRTLDALAVLDLVAAKVRLARRYDYRAPELLDDPVLRVRGARHPLLVALRLRQAESGESAPEIVPIDYRLGDDFNLLIITGPNTGGKTVTLKTVGLLTLMVQAGLPAPVDVGSSFGLFKSVLIDIGDEQNLQQSLSTFSAHLRRQLDMLQKAGPQTLVLIDELGAGTDPDEGAAIGVAMLDELLQRQCRCIATTHLGALKSFPLTRDRSENGCVEFDEQTLRPTYHLRIGEPGYSNAIAIAQRLGMPRRLVHEARRNLSRGARVLQKAISGTIEVKRQAEEARRTAEHARREADRVRDEAAAAQHKLEQRQAEFQQWVQRVVHLQPGDAVRVRDFDRDGRIVRVRIDLHRAEVDMGSFTVEVPLGDVLPPQTPAPPPRPPRPPPRETVAAVAAAEARAAEQRRQRAEQRAAPRPDRPRPERPPAPPLTDEQALALQPGDAVYVKRFHRLGSVVRVNPHKRVVLVSVGLLEVEVPFDGLEQPRSMSRSRD